MDTKRKIDYPHNIDELVTSENLATIRYWKRHGMTNQEVAKSCGIARSTLQRWATKNPLLKESLKIGKEQAIAVVENKLFAKALSGNMTAIIFWLKNNARNLYNDSQLSPDEIKQVKARTRTLEANARIAEVKANIAERLDDSASEQLDKILSTLVSEVDQDGTSKSNDHEANNGTEELSS